MKYLRRKTKQFKTKKEAENNFASLSNKKPAKIKGIKEKPKYSLCNVSEDNIVMTEKEIFGVDEIIEDKDVDTTEIHFCTHDSKGRGAGACVIKGLEEAREDFSDIKVVVDR